MPAHRSVFASVYLQQEATSASQNSHLLHSWNGEIFHLLSTVELNQSKGRHKNEESGPMQWMSLNLFNVRSSVKTELFALGFPKATFAHILHGLVYIHTKETAILHFTSLN